MKIFGQIEDASREVQTDPIGAKRIVILCAVVDFMDEPFSEDCKLSALLQQGDAALEVYIDDWEERVGIAALADVRRR